MKKNLHQQYSLLLACSLLVLFQIEAYPADFTSVQTGDWTSASTWGGSAVPKVNDNVTIASETTVTLTQNLSNAGLTNLTIEANAKLDGEHTVYISGTFTCSGICDIAEIDFKSGSTATINGELIAPIIDNQTTSFVGTGVVFSNSTDENIPANMLVSTLWKGATSSSWTESTNWYPTQTLPAASASVGISTDAANAPTISSDVNISSINVPEGQTLTITTDGSLQSAAAYGTGTTNIQRSIPSTDWHLVSSPAPGQLMSDFGSSSGLDSESGTYDIGIHNDNNGNWDYPVSTSTDTETFTKGQGVSIRKSLASGSGTVTFSGTLTAGNFEYPVVYTANNYGWNCIGNPYSSALNVSTFKTTNTTVLDDAHEAIYLWVESAGTYQTAATLGLTTVALGQGFFIDAVSTGGSIRFTSEMQTHNATAVLKSETIQSKQITLKAKSEENQYATFIRFDSDFTKGLDRGFDLGILKGNSNMALYTQLMEDNGVEFELQALPDDEFDTYRIPVGLDLPTGGQVTFSALTQNITADIEIILEDTKTKTFNRIDEENAEYTATVDAETTGFGRFYLLTSKSTNTGNSTLIKSKLCIFNKDKIIYINGKIPEKTSLELYSVNGKLLSRKMAEIQNQNTISAQHLPAGIYLIKIKSPGFNKSYKTILK